MASQPTPLAAPAAVWEPGQDAFAPVLMCLLHVVSLTRKGLPLTPVRSQEAALVMEPADEPGWSLVLTLMSPFTRVSEDRGRGSQVGALPARAASHIGHRRAEKIPDTHTLESQLVSLERVLQWERAEARGASGNHSQVLPTFCLASAP